MLRAILNKSRRQHPIKQLLYGHLLPIRKTIKIRWTRHVGHCWRSRYELISDVLQQTLSHGRTMSGWPAQTYIQQLCTNTGCIPEDLPETMDNMEGWQERVMDIHADGTTWWWWWCFSEIFNIFIIKGFQTIVFIFIVISTMFWMICPPAFFRCLLNSGTFTELWTMSSRTHSIMVIGAGSLSF